MDIEVWCSDQVVLAKTFQYLSCSISKIQQRISCAVRRKQKNQVDWLQYQLLIKQKQISILCQLYVACEETMAGKEEGSASGSGAVKIVEPAKLADGKKLENPNPIPLSPLKLKLNKSLACDIKPRQASVSVLSPGSSSPRPHSPRPAIDAAGQAFEQDAIKSQPPNSSLKMRKFNNSIGVDLKPRKPSTFK